MGGGMTEMALYTRLWAATKHESHAIALEPASTRTILAALELINTSSTPTRTEIKLAYSLWENQVYGQGFQTNATFSHRASA
jgi:hypothetical protein